ncbi:MAG: protoheme IX farnesyltransferase [Austwickia sp.]|nr:protoheme IX farnesyltransferase [Austwickia sp.]MBK9101052.1 protoheme IX farnesyltransferase [Austwickia sp.]
MAGHRANASVRSPALKDTVTAIQPRRDLPVVELTAPDGREPRATVSDYLSLVKPRIIELLLVTTFPVMFLAQRGVPPVGLILATLIGGTLSAGAANTLNCYIDRDMDRKMHRTENRPLVTGVISPGRALAFGFVQAVIALALLGIFVNVLSAALSLAAIVMYVWLYTIVLKRRTPQNIVWGGAAGCMQVLIGWSAVTNSLAWPAFVLFLVVFFWTPPHYWPLSMRFKDEYAAAGVPMLPVVASDVEVARQVLLYAVATVATSLALVPLAPMGWIYLVTALVGGGVFVAEGWKLLQRAKDPANRTLASLKPMRMFHLSITYLTLLFVALAIDPLVHLSLPLAF